MNISIISTFQHDNLSFAEEETNTALSAVPFLNNITSACTETINIDSAEYPDDKLFVIKSHCNVSDTSLSITHINELFKNEYRTLLNIESIQIENEFCRKSE